MPLISEEIGIISERMGTTSEEIRIVGEEIPGMNNAGLRGPARNLKVDENRRRRSVVVVGGEVFKTLLYRCGDFTCQRHLG